MWGQSPSSLLMLAGIALATFILLRGSRAYLARSRADKTTPQKIRDELTKMETKPTVVPPKELLRWEVEMHETARDLKAEIDTKLAALQALTISARQESERLEAAIEKAEQLGIRSDRP
jgi:hypothetical protein